MERVELFAGPLDGLIVEVAEDQNSITAIDPEDYTKSKAIYNRTGYRERQSKLFVFAYKGTEGILMEGVA